MKIADYISKLKAYQPGKPIEEVQRELGLERVIKLASNENPLGLSPRVKEALIFTLDNLSLYPDASCYKLTKAVAQYYGVEESYLGFGNGSEEVIDLAIRTFCSPSDMIMTSAHSFLIYKLSAQAFGLQTLETPMGEDLKFDLSEMKRQLLELNGKVRMVFIANPNNPTGTYLNSNELKDFIEFTQGLKDVLVVIDEAYNEFVRAEDYPNVANWLNDYKNLIVIRTFSKVFGLAGLRLGVFMANPEMVSYYQRVRKPFNVNSLAQVAGVAALEDVDYLEKSRQVNWSGLDFYYTELQKMNLKYWLSQANFVLCQLPILGEKAYQSLLREGVITRPVTGYGLPYHLRISVGLPDENQAAIVALKKILASGEGL